MNPQERRQEPRVRAAYQIGYECFVDGTKISEGTAYTIDLSPHGALVELAYNAALDATMILWISAPFYSMIVQGHVVHSRPSPDGMYFVGVKLTDMIEGGWDRLQQDVLSRLNPTDVRQ